MKIKALGAKGCRTETVQELRTVLAEVTEIEIAPAVVEVAIPEKDLAPQLRRPAKG